VTDLFTDPIVGWRLWHVRRHDDAYRLESFTWHHVAWPACRSLEASCALHRDAAPARDHVCGIYAFTTRALAEDLLRRYTGARQRYGRRVQELPPRAPGRPVALGRVSLWGRVFVRDNGFRAQHAYPYSLVVIGGGERVAAELRALYAVDATCA
jgi:hypothetical protein